MKLKSLVLMLAGAASFSLGAVAFAAAQQEQPGPGETEESHSAPVMPEQDTKMVQRAKEKLKAEGYDVGRVDGSWGRELETALTKFQDDEGLRATGNLDEDTLRALGLGH